MEHNKFRLHSSDFQVPFQNFCFFRFLDDFSGTGSGVGTFVLKLLQDEYPDVYRYTKFIARFSLMVQTANSFSVDVSCRFVTAVYPSLDDDVITSPYNSVLAMQQLTEVADCVLPVENQVRVFALVWYSAFCSVRVSFRLRFVEICCLQALVDIVNKIYQALPPEKYGKKVFGPSLAGVRVKKNSALTASERGVTKPSHEKPFDGMNNIVANMLLNVTRFVQK